MYEAVYRHLLQPLQEWMNQQRQTLDHWRNAERRQWCALDNVLTFQFEALRKVVAHAYTTTPYYRTRWKNLDVPPHGLTALDDFQKLPRITHAELTTHAREFHSETDYRTYQTSLNETVAIEHDQYCDERWSALMLRTLENANVSAGSRQLTITGPCDDNVPMPPSYSHGITQWLARNRRFHVDDLEPRTLDGLVEIWNDFSPAAVIAGRRLIEQLAKHRARTGESLASPETLFSLGDLFPADARHELEAAFRTRLIGIYGVPGFPVVGSECHEHYGLHVNIDNLVAEVLNEDGTPTPWGEMGELVLTDLFNYAMPLIRYRSGRQVRSGWEACSCGRGLPLLSTGVEQTSNPTKEDSAAEELTATGLVATN